MTWQTRRFSNGATTVPNTTRAEALYERVFFEYGDDSVAQLGGVHLACEGASNILTKVLEWGRLMAYLEQSTRYVPYDDRPGGRYRYQVPTELRSLCVANTWPRSTRPSTRTAPGCRDCAISTRPGSRAPRATPSRCTG